MRILLAVLAMTALAACASDDNRDRALDVADACLGYATALTIVSDAIELDQIDQSVLDRIDIAVEVLDPVCGSGGDYHNPEISIPAIKRNMAVLLGIAADIQEVN